MQLSYQFVDFCSNLNMLWNRSYELLYLAFIFLISGIFLCLAMVVQHCTFNHWLLLLNLRIKSIGWILKWTYSNFSSWLILIAIRPNLEFILPQHNIGTEFRVTGYRLCKYSYLPFLKTEEKREKYPNMFIFLLVIIWTLETFSELSKTQIFYFSRVWKIEINYLNK